MERMPAPVSRDGGHGVRWSPASTFGVEGEEELKGIFIYDSI